MNKDQSPKAEFDHRDIIRGLGDEDRKFLREKSDRAGLIHLAGHMGLIVASAAYVAAGLPFWQLVMLPYGIFLIFLFTLLHECMHDTPFKALWLNRVMAVVCGFVVLLPPTWFRYFHLAHHRHTHDPENDPELASPKPETRGEYLIYLSGIPNWISNIKNLFGLAFGGKKDGFVPARAMAGIRLEARVFIVAYAGLVLASILYSSMLILWLWVVPVLLGQPFLRLYLLAEHGLCPNVANMLDNTRTTYTTRFVRFIAWNMPYHTEHHTYPVVPFHKLPELHKLMRQHLRQTEDGYTAFHRKYVGRI